MAEAKAVLICNRCRQEKLNIEIQENGEIACRDCLDRKVGFFGRRTHELGERLHSK